MPTAAEIAEDAAKAGAYLVASPFFYAYEAWDSAEHSLQENVEKLEEQHKLLFATLALTNNVYCNLYKKNFTIWTQMKKLGKDYKLTNDYKTIIKLGVQIKLAAMDWFKTQSDLEKQANIPAVKITQADFLNAAKAVTILKVAQTFFNKNVSGEEISKAMQGTGIGNPVIAIVWAAAIISAGISIAYIVSRLTVSTQDRLNLLNATKQTCIDLKLSSADCASVMNTAQQEETKNSKGVTDAAAAVGSSFAKVGLVLGLLFVAGMAVKHKSK